MLKQSLLAQLVAAQVRAEERQAEMLAAQVQMLQAQVRADERQARTDARLDRIETHLEAVLDELRAEGQEGCCGYGEGHAESPGQASGDARRSA